MGRREHKPSRKLLQLLRQYPQDSAPSVRLVRGKYSANPGHVEKCYSYCRLDVPQLLTKHHSIPGLELWHCQNCRKKILIRVETQNA